MTDDPPPQPGQSARLRRQISWRAALLLLTFSVGLLGFALGGQASDREVQQGASWFTWVYYTLGLFVLGGMDLGVPRGGPALAQGLLWVAYFAAPAITTSAILEAALRLFQQRHLLRGPPRDHIILGGCGRVGLIFLAWLRQQDPGCRVLLLDDQPERPSVERARRDFGAEVFAGNITDPVALSRLHLGRAREVLFLTGDNFANLDAAAQVLGQHPALASHITVHLSDLRMHLLLDGAGLLGEVRRFNAHRVAARVLVRHKLLEHFQTTEPKDVVVLAGFGRFGQTVLDELQQRALGHFGQVVIMDSDARVGSLVFAQQVGVCEGYQLHSLEGDLRDPALWQQATEAADLDRGEPVFVLGCGLDYVNLRTAIWLRSRYPRAYIVVRCFAMSEFARQIAERQRLALVSVGELLADSLRQGERGDLWS